MLKAVSLHSHLKNGWLKRPGVLKKTDAGIKKLKNFAKRFGDLKIMRTFAARSKNGSSKGEFKKFIEKTDLLYKKQVPRKYNLSRSVNFFGN